MNLNPIKVCLVSCSALSAGLAFATDYHVGPSQRFPDLASVPFEKLMPGDNVLIHSKPGGYHESIQLMMSGTAAKHITVRGVPDSVTGRKPIIDGQNAKVGPSVGKGYYTSLYTYGGIIITPPKSFVWGDAPSYIDIEGLEIRNFNMRNTMTNLAGKTQSWDRFACGIYCERVRNLEVRNCVIHDNGNGFFCNSKYGGAAVSRNLLIENNVFANNGNPGSFSEHHLYTECDTITIQHNTFGPLVPDSGGSAIKDRSAGTVVRYNSMQVSKYGVGMYLVGPQGGSGYIEFLPNFGGAYVYGNVMYNPPVGGEAFIFFGGDSGYATARKGTLYSYQNTFVNQADGSGAKRRLDCFAYRLNTTAEFGGNPVTCTVESGNNVFFCVSETRNVAATNLYMVYAGGSPTINFGRDWISPSGRLLSSPRGWTGTNPTFNGLSNLVPPDPYNNPGLVDPSLGSRATNTAAFLKIVSPQTLVNLIDPNVLIRNIDLSLFWKCVDMQVLAGIIDPNLVFGIVDPNFLSGIIDPNLLLPAVKPTELVALVDPNVLVGLIDPNLMVGILDPNLRPSTWAPLGERGFAPSVLLGQSMPLLHNPPIDHVVRMEYRASGRWNSNWKVRTATGPFALGAFEPQR